MTATWLEPTLELARRPTTGRLELLDLQPEMLRPGGLLAVQALFPDPDRPRVPEIRGLAEPARFRFLDAKGHPWNYTVRLVRERSRARPAGC